MTLHNTTADVNLSISFGNASTSVEEPTRASVQLGEVRKLDRSGQVRVPPQGGEKKSSQSCYSGAWIPTLRRSDSQASEMALSRRFSAFKDSSSRGSLTPRCSCRVLLTMPQDPDGSGSIYTGFEVRI